MTRSKSSSAPSDVTPTAPPSRDFDPPDVTRHGAAAGLGDERGGALYVYSDRIKLAVRVALVTGRPLLVRGAPGWGKSSLAHAASNHLGWRYLEQVISSRTQARDLMSELDLVRRLSDAQRRGGEGDKGGVDPDWRRYIRPGVLWDAFDPVSAQQQRDFFDRREAPAAAVPEAHNPAVVLLDEMDKAEPDVPNNLLVALGSLQFAVDEIAEQKEGKRGQLTIKARPGLEPLIIVTTNDERDLPRAFLRRCVEIELPALKSEDREKFSDEARNDERIELLVKIGTEHLSQEKDKTGKPLDATFIRKIADVTIAQMKKGRAEYATVPSPAEFVDTGRAVGKLYGADVKTEQIEAILGIAVRKRRVSAT
jgi:MoxR-like ATPase